MSKITFKKGLIKAFVVFALSPLSQIFALSPLSDNSVNFALSPSSEKNFSFSFDAGMGFLNGYISEYVFSPTCKNTGNMLSRLDWDVSGIPYFEAEADCDFYKYFHFSAGGRIGLPVKSGFMQDYDWLNSTPSKPAWNDAPADELTNYSKHTNYLESYYGFNILLGGNIYMPDFSIIITPYAQFEYWFISFDGRDGYRTYKSENWERKDFSGSIISYKQEYNTVLIGVDALEQITDKLCLKANFAVSPFLVFNNSLDHHVRTDAYYLDIIKNAFEIKGNFKALYSFNRYLNFSLSTSLQYIPVWKGYDYNPTLYEGKIYVDLDNPSSVLGGTSSLLWDISFNCGINF